MFADHLFAVAPSPGGDVEVTVDERHGCCAYDVGSQELVEVLPAQVQADLFEEPIGEAGVQGQIVDV